MRTLAVVAAVLLAVFSASAQKVANVRSVKKIAMTIDKASPKVSNSDEHGARSFSRGGLGPHSKHCAVDYDTWLSSGKLVTRNRYSRKQSVGSINVAPTAITDGMDVTVYTSGISRQSDYDFVAIYSPPNPSDGNLLNFLDSMPITAVDTNNNLVFTDLVNMRSDYMFRYFQVAYEGADPVLAYESSVVTMLNQAVPGHVHLALVGSDVTKMIVQFTTPSDMNPNLYTVHYGTNPDAGLNMVSLPPYISSSYNASQMCGAIANVTAQMYYRDTGILNSIMLTGLAPLTRYYYYVSFPTGTTKTFSFVTGPAVSPSGTGQVTRFIAYADHGLSPPEGGASATVARVLDDFMGPDGFDNFVIHFGDISYARGQGYMWEQYMQMIEPVAARAPYMISIGNHEYDHLNSGDGKDPSKVPGNGWHPWWGDMGDDSHGECGVPTFYRFNMPGNANSKFWYSFDYGNVHVAMMSSEHNWTRGSEQWLWLQNDLASVNRDATPFVIVTAHRPMYTSETLEQSDYTVSLHMQQELEDLIYQHGVDLMLTGHYHSYERTCAVYKQACNPAGTTHICVGTAGAGLETGAFPSNVPWSKAHANLFGYSRITATNTVLKYDFLLNEDGSIYDTITLQARETKNRKPVLRK